MDLAVLLPHNAGEAKFKLKAALFHEGMTLNSGHYFSFVDFDGVMFKCNDHHVAELKGKKVADEQRDYASVYVGCTP